MEKQLHGQLSFFDNDIGIEKTPLIAGKTVAITGELNIPRKSAIAQIEAANGKYSSSVTKKTNYLVVGRIPKCVRRFDSATRKLVRVRQLQSQGVKVSIICETELWQLL